MQGARRLVASSMDEAKHEWEEDDGADEDMMLGSEEEEEEEDDDEYDEASEFTQAHAWVVIDAYFKEKGLVRQQLDSFDYFINTRFVDASRVCMAAKPCALTCSPCPLCWRRAACKRSWKTRQ